MKTLTTSLFIIICCAFGSSTYAQGFFRKQSGDWYLGGDLQYASNSSSSIFAIAPELTYVIENGIEGGLGMGYTSITNGNLKQKLFSLGPVLGYRFKETVFIRTQLQQLTGTATSGGNSVRLNETALWIGGGYLSNSGNGVTSRIGIMYNTLYKEDNSIYSTPLLPYASISFAL